MSLFVVRWLYCLLAHVQYIQDAIREFEGTSEEVRVTVADCELAIARGDVEGALKKLRRIPKVRPHPGGQTYGSTQ